MRHPPAPPEHVVSGRDVSWDQHAIDDLGTDRIGRRPLTGALTRTQWHPGAPALRACLGLLAHGLERRSLARPERGGARNRVATPLGAARKRGVSGDGGGVERHLSGGV
eukprot:COSAG01_NODE_24170_length_788_cov_0.589260_2_plen_108_part_01